MCIMEKAYKPDKGLLWILGDHFGAEELNTVSVCESECLRKNIHHKSNFLDEL